VACSVATLFLLLNLLALGGSSTLELAARFALPIAFIWFPEELGYFVPLRTRTEPLAEVAVTAIGWAGFIFVCALCLYQIAKRFVSP
jgi:hypothetical protein